jgi:hypothetical protein
LVWYWFCELDAFVCVNYVSVCDKNVSDSS